MRHEELGVRVDNSEIVDALSKTDLFGALDADFVAHLADHAAEVAYRKGQIIFREGDQGDALYVIARGAVKVFLKADQREEMVLVTLHAPETFGELALIDSGPRSASTEALEDTTLVMLKRGDLLTLFHDIPQLMDALLKVVGRSLRRLTGQTADLVFLDLEGRVAKLLVQLADQRGEPVDGGVVLDLAMTQTDLAGMVGGSRQSINQILHAFQNRGYLELQRQRVILKRPELLQRRASV